MLILDTETLYSSYSYFKRTNAKMVLNSVEKNSIIIHVLNHFIV